MRGRRKRRKSKSPPIQPAVMLLLLFDVRGGEKIAREERRWEIAFSARLERKGRRGGGKNIFFVGEGGYYPSSHGPLLVVAVWPSDINLYQISVSIM